MLIFATCQIKRGKKPNWICLVMRTKPRLLMVTQQSQTDLGSEVQQHFFLSACFLSGSIYGVFAQNLPIMLLSIFLYRIIPLWHFWEKSWQKITSSLSLQWQNSCISSTRYADLTVKYAKSHYLILHSQAANSISSFSPEEFHCAHTWNHSGNPGPGLQECDSVDCRSLQRE